MVFLTVIILMVSQNQQDYASYFGLQNYASHSLSRKDAFYSRENVIFTILCSLRNPALSMAFFEAGLSTVQEQIGFQPAS